MGKKQKSQGEKKKQKKTCNKVLFFNLFSQLRITVCTLGSQMGNGLACYNMNLITWSDLFSCLDTVYQEPSSSGKLLKM